ncbi:MAG: glycerophosphodiester phosphodiesterase family protein, partial [Acidiferrobacterales bacterium]
MPENSMPAFQKALSLGVPTLELDLQVTKDRVLVVYHDPRLNPTLCVYDDGRKVRKELMERLTFDGLADIDCGRRRNSRFPEQQTVPGTRIPRLETVLKLARDAGYPVRLSIEIKWQRRGDGLTLERFAQRLVALINEYGLESRTIV